MLDGASAATVSIMRRRDRARTCRCADTRFSGKLDGFVYGSMREMKGERYRGFGIGALL